jgi:allophanate hydrolase
MLYEGAWVAERLAAVSGFMAEHPDALHPVTARIIGGARGLTAEDAFKGFYKLEALKRQAETLLEGIDLLVVPTVPTLYAVADLERDPIGPNSNLGTYTNFVNLLDMCGLAIPAGRRSDGLPFSITLLGRGGEDRLLMDIAGIVNGKAAGKPQAGNIDIVVVGAHLSGMPLNHELVSLGARLVKTARTLPEYRLFALPGTAPAKPGMLRVGPEDGRSIEVEIWSLSATAFATFVSAIGSPLGIGRIRLDDGSLRQGFLVEQIAVAGALDVSDHGGWRSYMTSLASEPA